MRLSFLKQNFNVKIIVCLFILIALVNSSFLKEKESCSQVTIGLYGNPNPYLRQNFTQVKWDQNYVNWVQQRGAVTVPISPHFSDEELYSALSKVNGVIFLGGNVTLRERDIFGENALKIINYTKEQNLKGNPFLLFGICQGHELINALIANTCTGSDFFQVVRGVGKKPMSTIPYTEKQVNWKLGNYLKSKGQLEAFTTYNVNAHYHKWSVSFDAYETTEIKGILDITSYQVDDDGLKFVDTFQSVEPFNIQGVQFHPDKFVDPTYYYDFFGPENWEKGLPVSQAMADFVIETVSKSNYCRDRDDSPLIDFASGVFPLSYVCRETISFYINDRGHNDDNYICDILGQEEL